MVGIDEIPALVSERSHGCIGFTARLHRLGADDLMLTVGLVPNRVEMHAEALLCLNEGLQLIDSLVRKAVSNSE